MKTEFEVLRRYKMHGGGVAKVTRIHAESSDDDYPLGFTAEGDDHEIEHWATLKGQYWGPVTPHCYDLLLPAIGPEGEVAVFSDPTKKALRQYFEFWDAFHTAVKANIISATSGKDWPEWDEEAVISCTYASKEAALADAEAVIADIKRLLEGGAR